MNDIAPVSGPPRGPQFDNRRVLAGLIDVALVAVVAGVISVAAGGAWSPTLSALVLAWGLFYYFALESGAGQTVGKRLLGLRVTMPDGSAADMRAIAVRTVLRVIDGIGLYLVGLIVMLVSGERRQRLGDMAAGTIITSAEARPVPATAPAPTAAQAPPAVVLPETVSAEPETVAPESPIADPLPVVDVIAPEPPAPVIEPAVEVVEEPAPSAFEPPAPVEPAPSAFEASEPSVESAPAAFEAPEPAIELPAAETLSVPELKPFEPFSAPAADNGATPDPAVEVTPEPAVEESPDEPVKVRSVETISAIDLLMEDVEEDEAAGSTPTA